MANRTCDQLGVCQSREPRCARCNPWPFAPGAVTVHHRPGVWARIARAARRLLWGS